MKNEAVITWEVVVELDEITHTHIYIYIYLYLYLYTHLMKGMSTFSPPTPTAVPHYLLLTCVHPFMLPITLPAWTPLCQSSLCLPSSSTGRSLIFTP